MIDIIMAVLKLIGLYFTKSEETKTARKEIKDEIAKAIKNDDTTDLHRLIGRL